MGLKSYSFNIGTHASQQTPLGLQYFGLGRVVRLGFYFNEMALIANEPTGKF
jgi:hypothetical protein